MSYLKGLGLVLMAVSVLSAVAASGASATTLEVKGVAQNQSVEIAGSHHALKTGPLLNTSGTVLNSCTTFSFSGSTQSPFSSTRVTWALSSLSFSNCERAWTVHKAGKMYVEYSSGTNGTLFSEEAEITVGTSFGTVNCKTGSGTHLGVVKGTASGNASIQINATLNCGFLLPSAKWESTWISTKPEGLGVVS